MLSINNVESVRKIEKEPRGYLLRIFSAVLSASSIFRHLPVMVATVTLQKCYGLVDDVLLDHAC